MEDKWHLGVGLDGSLVSYRKTCGITTGIEINVIFASNELHHMKAFHGGDLWFHIESNHGDAVIAVGKLWWNVKIRHMFAEFCHHIVCYHLFQKVIAIYFFVGHS